MANKRKPAIPTDVVEERDLNFGLFRCCGDEDLYPFGCPDCGRLMVFCYECDTLYDDLCYLYSQTREINNFNTAQPIFSCSNCGYPFEYFFMRDGSYKVPREQWMIKGFAHLLKE